MTRRLDAEMTWLSAQEYRDHPARDYYEQLPVPARASDGRRRFGPKRDDATGARIFHVDHYVPWKIGGLNHPKNYVIMHRALNQIFGGDDAGGSKRRYVVQHLGVRVVEEIEAAQRRFRDRRPDAYDIWSDEPATPSRPGAPPEEAGMVLSPSPVLRSWSRG